MFWETPKLPVTEDQQKWIDESFRWLLQTFGETGFLAHRTILPEPAFFPDKYRGTQDCVLTLVKRVCGYMEVDPNQVETNFFSDKDETAARHRLGGASQHSGAAGLYFHDQTPENRHRIAINTSEFQNPMGLVATIAHELGHVILLGGGKIRRDEKDHEHLTDLITVFMGLGIFTANAAFQFAQWQDHSHQGWSASRKGYMSEEMFAYSLAAYAWMRGESKPAWSRHLAMNVGYHFKQSQKCLRQGIPTSLPQLKSN